MAKNRKDLAFTRERLDHLHAHAECLRALVGASPDAPIDAAAVADALEVQVKYVDGLDVADFSGMLRFLPNGRPVALLNSQMTPERANVTLLEELCHLHYNHPVVSLELQGRTYDEAVEQEAYQTAAAVLLPAVVVAKGVFHRVSVEDLAREYGASTELVVMRIKVLSLWPLYRPVEAV